MEKKDYKASALVYSKKYIPHTTPTSDVIDYFKKHTSNFLAVAQEGKIIGIIGREKLFLTVGSQFGWALHSSSTIMTLMDKNPLIYDGNGNAIELLRKAVARPIETVYDDVIIADKGIFAGLVSVKQLMLIELENLDAQLKTLVQHRTLLEKTIASHLLDQNVSPEMWNKKIDAVVSTAQQIEALEQEKAELPPQSTQQVKLQGHLDVFSVIDLIQLLVQGGKTGRLELLPNTKNDKGRLMIYVDNGKILHAEGCGDSGVNALWRALRLAQGEFSFLYGFMCDTITINDNPMSLLLEGCRRQDEEAHSIPN